MVTRTVTWMGVLTCIACGGPNDETLVDELRVLSMVSNPPEVTPGETYVIQHLTHIPLGTGSERITWPCTFDGTGCAEAAFATQLDDWVHLTEPNGDEVSTSTWRTPEGLQILLSEENPQVQIPHWTLACAPGLCPIIDAVRRAPEPGTSEWTAVADALANPFDWLAEYPKKGVSLATKAVSVSVLPDGQRNVNPILSRDTTTPVTVSLEGSVSLEFTVTDEDPLTAFGYTTLGGFGATREDISSGTFTQTLYAPVEETDNRSGTLYVIVNDARGGSAIWTESFILEE